MAFEIQDRLTPFHDKAITRGIPADDVERWSANARPCATLALKGEGPVVGRFGGPLLLPADTPDPVHPFVASIDLAALPAGVTDLPLPADGHLLLFAYPEFDSCFDDDMGSVLHVPAGTAVVERDKDSWSWNDIEDYQEMVGRFPLGPLLATEDVSLPHHWMISLPEEPWAAALPGHPRSEELAEVWDDSRDGSIWGTLQLGGYANEEVVETDPVARAVRKALGAVDSGRIDWPVSDDVADWALLVDWHLDIDGWEGASFHWSIQREDLAARRFDRTITTVFWNP